MATNVVLYSTQGCPLCERYRTLLTQKNQKFEERNTTTNPKYLDELSSKGIMVVPTVIVDGKAVTGFRPNSLLELI